MTACREESPVILLAVANSEDRRLIKKYLGDDYVVTVPDGLIIEQAFDICIVDDAIIQQNRNVFLAHKEEAAPLFLPILLLSDNKRRVRSNATVLEFVDDVIHIPITTSLLKSRIQQLLRTRQYSLKLNQKNQQLEEKNRQLRIYEQAINSTNAGVLITDANKEDNPIVFCNEGFKNLTGYSEEEILGRNCRFLQDHDRSQESIKEIRSIIDSGDQGNVIIRNYQKDGTLFWNELSIAPITDKNDTITHFVGIQRDITQLIETQQKLQEEKERYRLITENSTDMISRHAPDGTYLYVTPSSEQLIGFTPDELVGKNAYEFFHPDDIPEIAQKHSFISASSNSNPITYRIKTKSGSYKWVETASRTVLDPQSERLIEIQASTRDVSERKEYEHKLEKERNLFKKLTQSSPIGIAIIATDGQISFANNKAEQILGLTKSEIKELTYNDPKWNITGLDGEPFPVEKLPFRQVMDTEEAVYDVRHAIEWSDGQRKLLSINAAPLTGADGSIEGVIASLIDITKQTKQERKLKEEQEFISTAIESQPGIFFLVNEEMDFVLWNNAMEQELGYSGEEIEQMHPLEFFKDTDHSLIQSKIDETLRSGSAEVEIEIISKSGEPIHYFIMGTKLKRENGTFIIGSAVNTEERVRAERKLRESEQRWELLIQKDPNMVLLSDRDRIIKFINPAGTELFGKEDPAELIGRPWSDFLTLEDQELNKQRIERAYRGEHLEPHVFKVKTWDGRDLYLELQGVPIEYQNEKVIMTVGQDATERIRYEKELEQSLAEKNTLLQEVHHRVKNNLAVVSGLLEIQAGDVDNEEMKEVLMNSQMRIQSIANVHELIYQQDELNYIDFSSYIQRLTKSTESIYWNRKLDLKFKLDLEPVMISLDQAVPCGMVLNELITNSIKHAFPRQKEGTVSIELRKNSKEEKVHIVLSDNGVGIPDTYDLKKEKTMGSTIIALLTQQLKADLKYSGTDEGSRFELSFYKKGYSGPLKKV
ncbi:PAS domain S-box protein [Aliifodinibius sp. S!AR15-10]|uniref:PAS domain S-box protein n=1 Tax=Aliifodinibius sp. S!AR15-10 TaxID=2950437 RepID=UPI0028700665|nr:PAS domain S-box protein [Aliifodinibius sp. S!AR15-10]